MGVRIFIIISIILIVGLLSTHYYNNRIAKEAHKVVCVHIDNIYFRRGGIYIEFGYSFNGIYYHTGFGNEAGINEKCYRQYDDEAKRNILIVVLKDKPDIFDVLENTDDFKKFNIVPSDTAGLICDNLIFNSQ